jgi:hypothetical protein
MNNTMFSIVATSPLVDTASGETAGDIFSGSFSSSLESRKIGLDSQMIGTKDNEKIKELHGDLLAVIFNFIVPNFHVSSLCEDIAKEILQHKYFSPQLKILVEGKGVYSVISLSSVNIHNIAKQIQEIVITV